MAEVALEVLVGAGRLGLVTPAGLLEVGLVGLVAAVAAAATARAPGLAIGCF